VDLVALAVVRQVAVERRENGKSYFFLLPDGGFLWQGVCLT